MKTIKNILTFSFWIPLMAFYGLWVNACVNETLHEKLFYTKKVLSYNNFSGIEIIDISTNFLGIPILTLNMEFFAPLLEQGFLYGMIFLVFLSVHNLLGCTFLDPAGDSVIHDTRPLRVTMGIHFKHVIEYMFWYLCFIGAFYGIMGMFLCSCPTPFLRSLIGLFIGFTTFETMIYKKTGYYLTPFVPKRFDAILLSLIWIEYTSPGKAIEFIKILPIFYAFWFYKIGQYRERYAGIFFMSSLPPEPGDECYKEYREYKRESSLIFNVIKYVKNKVGNYQKHIN